MKDYDIKIQKEKYEETYYVKKRKSDSEIVADLCATISEATNQLTESINESSVTLVTELQNINNLLEKNMLLNDYYSLISKINECEKHLLALNKLKDAYKELESSSLLYRELNFSHSSVEILLSNTYKNNPDFIKNLFEICIENKKDIIEYLSSILSNEELEVLYSINYQVADWWEGGIEHFFITTKSFNEAILIEGLISKYFSLEFLTPLKVKLKKYESSANYSFSIVIDDNHELPCYFKNNYTLDMENAFMMTDFYLKIDSFTAKRILLQQNYSCCNSNFDEDLSFFEFKQYINQKNFDISLLNLREKYKFLNEYLKNIRLSAK